jgi:hypothetical protein
MSGLLRALPYLLIMLAVVPILSFCCSGSWRTAWRYTLVWATCVGAMAAVGGMLVLIIGV